MGIVARIVHFASIATLALAWTCLARAGDPTSISSDAPAATGGQAGGAYAAGRVAFLEAYARTSAGETDSSHDTALLRHYPLYPYLEAARIRQALRGTPSALPQADEQAGAFIVAHAREPVSRGVRRAWLESLAERQRWDMFLEAYSASDANDALRCQSFTARIALGRSDDLAAEIAKEWLTPASLPECERPFDWLKERGLLTPELIEQRVRLALLTGNAAFAREIAQQLPPDRAAPLLQWVMLLEFPERTLDTLLSSATTAVDPTALLSGWSRLARRDPEAAEARFASLVTARGLSGERASPYALVVALGLAWERDPAALSYFDRVTPTDLGDEAIEWRARTALWLGDWKLASQAIAALSEADRQTPRWRYWAARVAEQTHDGAAQELYESVLDADDYYSAMAATRLHRPVVAHPESLPLDRAILASLERRPALIRARELFFCGLRLEAEAEWRAGVESLSAPERLQTIHLAATWGWYDQAIAAATAERVFNDYGLLYPRPYEVAVRAAARHADLAPALIYGVVRQESLYSPDAVSSAGARGLMQLELGTARRTAHFWKSRRPQPSDLFDPDTNISLGAERLRMLLDRFGGQLPVALSAYNAGISAAERWLPPQAIESDVWIENIPYNETREYVERVMWHSVLYSWMRADGEPQRVGSWLSPIAAPLHRVAGVEPR